MSTLGVKIAPTRGSRAAITLRGGAGSLVWGYRPAAQFVSWVVWKESTAWKLKAVVKTADPFQCRQRPLLFTAPKTNGPPWCWEVQEIRIQDQTLMATLGAPLV